MRRQRFTKYGTDTNKERSRRVLELKTRETDALPPTLPVRPFPSSTDIPTIGF